MKTSFLQLFPYLHELLFLLFVEVETVTASATINHRSKHLVLVC